MQSVRDRPILQRWLIGLLALALGAGVGGPGRTAAAPALPASAPAAVTAHGPMSAASASSAAHQRARERNRPKVVAHDVDINSAARKELMTLPGIGAAEAARIIAHRPYLTKTELVTKGVLPTGPFLSLRHLVVAMQPGVGKASKSAGKVAAAASVGGRP